LVRVVTPEVKDFTSPSTLLEKPWTPVTTDAAKDAPGTLTVDFPPIAGMETGRAEPIEPVETG
jgi:hypothetical protein